MESSKFQCVWGLATRLQQSGDTVQTKQDLLCSILLQHFSNRGSGSRSKAIVFAQYRRMVATIEATLNRHSPIIQARSFVGQAASNGAAGMNQEEQRELVEQFRSSDGECNVLVATSIGEEGLDIGEVDIIVQYDCVSSHIRSVQRIGRTGRKRDGRAIQLVSAGREQEALAKQRKTANAVKQTLSRNAKWKYHPLGAYPMLGPLPPPELHVRKLNQPESRPSSNLGAAVRAAASSSNHVGSAKAMNGVALQVDQNTSCVPTSASHSDGDRSVPLPAETATQPAAPLQSQRRESSSGLSAAAGAPDNDDIDLEAIATRFPLSCSVPSVTRRLGHSKLAHLLYTACVDTGGLDENECGARGQPSPERTQDESDTIDLTTETNADTHIQEIACSGHSGSSFPVDQPSLAEAAKDAAGRRSSGRSDAYSSELVELLEILPSHGCESTFAPCPPEIRHLLPDFVNVSRASALSGYGRRGQMRRPSYMSDLHDHNVRPPPGIRSEMRSTGAAAVSVTAPANPDRVGSGISEAEVNPDVNPSSVDSSVSTAGSGAAQPRAAPVAPAGRGLTEQQRRRIAENRKKAQARRAQAKAEQAAITSAASAGQESLTSNSEPAHAATSERDERRMLSAETPEPSNVSQQIDASDDSEFEAPARSAAIGPSDSDLVLSSSPSPAVMGRLRKGAGTKMPKKKRSRLPDAHSQSDTRETSRAAGAGRRTRRRKQQFADTEAAVSDGDSSDDSLDEDGATESDGMGDFLVDSMTQPLDIAGSSPEGRPSQGRSSDCSDDSECSQRAAARPQHMDMGDVYRRSLFSQGADEMGFASPP